MNRELTCFLEVVTAEVQHEVGTLWFFSVDEAQTVQKSTFIA